MRELIVPESCPRGHELTPPTTHIKIGKTNRGIELRGWSCVRCLRTDVWRAYYGPQAVIPAERLDEAEFVIQANATTSGRRAPWCARVLFLSDKQFDDYVGGRRARKALAA